MGQVYSDLQKNVTECCCCEKDKNKNKVVGENSDGKYLDAVEYEGGLSSVGTALNEFTSASIKVADPKVHLLNLLSSC